MNDSKELPEFEDSLKWLRYIQNDQMSVPRAEFAARELGRACIANNLKTVDDVKKAAELSAFAIDIICDADKQPVSYFGDWTGKKIVVSTKQLAAVAAIRGEAK